MNNLTTSHHGAEDLLAPVDETLPPLELVEPRHRQLPKFFEKPDMEMIGPTLAIPPTRPLSFDLLVYSLGFLWHASDIGTLNSIRLTSRAVRGLVDKQVVFAHNFYYFEDHRRLAKLLALVLRKPSVHLPLLHTLRIQGVHSGDWHSWDNEVQLWTARSCVCASLLAKVLKHSRFLQHIDIWDIELTLMADKRLADAFSASSSLRKLVVRDGVGPQTVRMFRRISPGVRELEVYPYDHDLWDMGPEALMANLRGLSSSLENLVLHSGDRPLDVGITDADLVWPHVHSIKLECVWAEAPELVHAFPNLRNLWSNDEEYNVTGSRERSQSLGLCWARLNDVRICISALCAAALTARVRRLEIVDGLSKTAHALYFLEDLPAIRPTVLHLPLQMVSVLPGASLTDDEDTAESDDESSGRGINGSLAGRLLNALSGVRALKLSIIGEGTAQTLEAVDQYINILTSSLNAPILESLRLHLIMHRPSYQRYEMGSDSDTSNSTAAVVTASERKRRSCTRLLSAPPWPLGEQLGKHMDERGKRALAETLAKSAPSLRYIFISGWCDDFEHGHHWEVLRPATTIIELREMQKDEGFQTHCRYEQINHDE